MIIQYSNNHYFILTRRLNLKIKKDSSCHEKTGVKDRKVDEGLILVDDDLNKYNIRGTELKCFNIKKDLQVRTRHINSISWTLVLKSLLAALYAKRFAGKDHI